MLQLVISPFMVEHHQTQHLVLIFDWIVAKTCVQVSSVGCNVWQFYNLSSGGIINGDRIIIGSLTSEADKTVDRTRVQVKAGFQVHHVVSGHDCGGFVIVVVVMFRSREDVTLFGPIATQG
ncbi:Uncharacterized protein Rs2_34080 [Raphanus sativus]|nr:Uncharacterized protein Rs2_34080 [Raphanus sativus]